MKTLQIQVADVVHMGSARPGIKIVPALVLSPYQEVVMPSLGTWVPSLARAPALIIRVITEAAL